MCGLKFVIFFLSLSISSNQQDWQEVWLRDCFWHFLFCFILVVIMIIWRPSSNSSRFAYSLVNDLDPEDEEEEKEMENKNFGKTRQGVRSEFLSLGGHVTSTESIPTPPNGGSRGAWPPKKYLLIFLCRDS